MNKILIYSNKNRRVYRHSTEIGGNCVHFSYEVTEDFFDNTILLTDSRREAEELADKA